METDTAVVVGAVTAVGAAAAVVEHVTRHCSRSAEICSKQCNTGHCGTESVTR